MEKEDVVNALMSVDGSPFAAEDKESLMAMSDGALTCMAKHLVDPPEPKPEPEVKAAEEKKPLTEEEYLAQAPDSIKSIVSEHKAAQAAKRTKLVNELKVAQSAYSEAELTALPTDQLEKISKITTAAAPKKDFSLSGAPRAAASAEEDENSAPKPIDMNARIRAAQKAS